MDAAALEREGLAAAAAASSTAEIETVRVEYLGRKSAIKQALREVRDRETGIALNAVRERLEAAIDTREAELARAELDARLTTERADITLPVGGYHRGRLHLITQIRREVEDVFLGLGYRVVDGREVESTRYNFDALNFPPGHPARSPLATLFVDDETVLRTETSPSQIRTMEEQQPPVYIVSLGRTYRRDTPDATHSPIFHQVEGLVVDRGITLGDLKGTLAHFARSLFGADRETRFRTSFFPFTEPSVEVDVSCFLCDGSGCAACKHSGWVEILGAGEVDPNVLAMADLDTSEWQGFAFGMGIERIAFLKHGVPDLRMLYENDLRFLEQFG
jgi:phenylalanyl-tRNA synthetase alpha chain